MCLCLSHVGVDRAVLLLKVQIVIYFTAVECPTPEPIRNGVYKGGSYGLGDTITYSCSEGYELVGSPNRMCQLNSSWQGAEPHCQGNNHCL